MGDVVNLRMARKRAARAARDKAAADNRAASSTPPKAKRLARALAKADSARLDAHRLETPPADK